MAVIINVHYIMLAKTGMSKLLGARLLIWDNSKYNDVICSDVRWITMSECGVHMRVIANAVTGLSVK